MGDFAAGAGFDASQLRTLIALLVAAIALVWVAWVAYGQLEGFAAGRARLFDAIWYIVFATVVLLLLLLFVR